MLFKKNRSTKKFSVTLPQDIAQDLEGLARQRKTTVEALLQNVSIRYIQEHVPRPGEYRADIHDPEGPITRLAYSLLSSVIKDGMPTFELPKQAGESCIIIGSEGQSITLPAHVVSYVWQRYEVMTTVERGTISINHGSKKYTVHVSVSGEGIDKKMRLRIEDNATRAQLEFDYWEK